MNPSIEEIKNAITSAVSKSSQPILGAQLGGLIRNELPAGAILDMKGRFGGLRRMLEKCAPGQIFWVGKSGLDDLFSTNPAMLKKPLQASAWVVFHNPDVDGYVYFDRSAQQLRSGAESSTPEGCDGVERVSHAEQRKMIQDFVEQHVDEASKALFVGVSNAEDGKYWGLFNAALASSRMLSEWQKFRFRVLRELAINHLEKAGVDEKLRELVVDRAIKDSSKMRSLKTPHKDECRQICDDKTVNFDGKGLHALAAQIVVQMSDEELAGMNVPLGAVWKALKALRGF